jgi:hypothetical protein
MRTNLVALVVLLVLDGLGCLLGLEAFSELRKLGGLFLFGQRSNLLC